VNRRNVYASFFKNVSIGNYARFSSATFRPFPNIFDECCFAVNSFKCAADLILQRLNIFVKNIFSVDSFNVFMLCLLQILLFRRS